MERRAKVLAAKGDAPAGGGGGGGPRPKKEVAVSGSAGKEQRGTASEQLKPQGKAPRPVREKVIKSLWVGVTLYSWRGLCTVGVVLMSSIISSVLVLFPELVYFRGREKSATLFSSTSV